MKDYRVGIEPARRPAKIKECIRRAVKSREMTFSDLLKETRASRSALAYHLKEMYKEGEIKKEEDSEDLRITYYSLTDKGRDSLERDELYEALINSVDEQLLQQISLEVLLEIELAKKILDVGIDKFRSEYLEKPALAFLLKTLNINTTHRDEATEKMIMREALERFNQAFSFRIYSPVPIREDTELDKELYLLSLWMLTRAIAKKLSLETIEDVKKLLQSDNAKIILNIQLDMKKYA